MKRFVCASIVLASLLMFSEGVAQQVTKKYPTKESILAESDAPNAFARKKFRYGASFNSYWSSISGSNLPKEYFWKPSLGIGFRFEYHFKEWIGLSTAFAFQQGGAGVINQDISGGAFSHPWVKNKFGVQGDPDSTHLEKLRFNMIEVPVMIALRTPKDVLLDGWRVSGAFGINILNNFETNDIWNSVVDGFHVNNFVTEQYVRKEIGLIGSLGFDIDSGTGYLFQCQFVYMKGTSNVYTAGQGDGRQQYAGIRFTWLY